MDKTLSEIFNLFPEILNDCKNVYSIVKDNGNYYSIILEKHGYKLSTINRSILLSVHKDYLNNRVYEILKTGML